MELAFITFMRKRDFNSYTIHMRFSVVVSF